MVGVHPAYQGRGLARPLTALGLAHLAGLGLPEVVLYVDGDNTAALRTYGARVPQHHGGRDVFRRRSPRGVRMNA